MPNAARLPVIRGGNCAASGTLTLTWTAAGVFGMLSINNVGPGKASMAFGGSAPANTTPATGVLVLAAGDKVSFENMELDQAISFRADATVGGADISAFASMYPEAGQGGFA